MRTAICAVLRFYKGSITREDIRGMTPDQFHIIVSEIETVAKLEQGESTLTPPKEMIEAMKRDPAINKRKGVYGPR